jgi:phospho-N-acetylmuramoyl-pentapeptide-transferase
MLYTLYNYFGINLFQYITVRAGFAFFVALGLTLWLMPKFIAWAKRKEMSQPIYDHAPDSHKHKAKTPTMGGVVFIIATLVATIFAAKLNNVYVVTGLLTIIAFGLIGVKDDLSKILFQDNSAGLTPRSKMFFQMSASLILVIILLQFGHNSELYVPFYKNPIFEMGLFALPFWVFVMVGSSNAVNLTDGLDGLATVPSMFALASLSIYQLQT